MSSDKCDGDKCLVDGAWPETDADIHAARHRLVWDEALGVQLALALRRQATAARPAPQCPPVAGGLLDASLAGVSHPDVGLTLQPPPPPLPPTRLRQRRSGGVAAVAAAAAAAAGAVVRACCTHGVRSWSRTAA